ncbi:hypothetical protein [Geoalkalibacter halelectricus]|uniref:hypothetical protein n=1 Tax=Geoalkalibacter halelectricus TaxID=2847045 RepID=UPI00266FD3BE|nr:hypothetical protein [Geoalkalibacter halelectricus]MDO3377345.1 hypothetical protein [Geoalkalibacter halelectricus]
MTCPALGFPAEGQPLITTAFLVSVPAEKILHAPFTVDHRAEVPLAAGLLCIEVGAKARVHDLLSCTEDLIAFLRIHKSNARTNPEQVSKNRFIRCNFSNLKIPWNLRRKVLASSPFANVRMSADWETRGAKDLSGVKQARKPSGGPREGSGEVLEQSFAGLRRGIFRIFAIVQIAKSAKGTPNPHPAKQLRPMASEIHGGRFGRAAGRPG